MLRSFSLPTKLPEGIHPVEIHMEGRKELPYISLFIPQLDHNSQPILRSICTVRCSNESRISGCIFACYWEFQYQLIRFFVSYCKLRNTGWSETPDCFWEWITFNMVEIEMWIICRLVKKLVENMRWISSGLIILLCVIIILFAAFRIKLQHAKS